MKRYKNCPKCGKSNKCHKTEAQHIAGIEFDIIGVISRFHCMCGYKYSDYESRRMKCADT